MYVYVESPQCSKCGHDGRHYLNGHTFEQGIVCDHCGHRMVTVPGLGQQHQQTYTANNTRRQF